jgi:hypothetical protein
VVQEVNHHLSEGVSFYEIKHQQGNLVYEFQLIHDKSYSSLQVISIESRKLNLEVGTIRSNPQLYECIKLMTSFKHHLEPLSQSSVCDPMLTLLQSEHT